ncbi:MAG: toll/interleukin-1 receptor domain-containing protein [Chloroflexi bacterium]|nr:toll/interleukin-1 receptor domain-containing protein [Chloroflexota bacterium]
MFFNIRFRTFIIVLALLLLGVLTNLLTNFASQSTPQILKDYPYLIWVCIGITIFFSVLLSVLQTSNAESKYPLKSSQISMNRLQSASTLHSNVHVFISYSNKDTEWVEKILIPYLDSHGIKAFTDRKFKGGSLSIEQMASSIENSKYTIAVMTKNFMTSEWTRIETAMAQTLNPDASERKLVPILLEDCDIPLRLRVLHYRDLRNNEEWDQLIEDLI